VSVEGGTAVVVYEASTGNVVHVETTGPGGAELASDEAIEAALSHVTAPGPLATLVVDADELRAAGPRFRVDPAAGTLVPL
jgi:hypothetical protein